MRSCQDYQEDLPLLLMEALPPEEEGPLRAHLEGCEVCLGEYQAISETLAVLGPAAEVEPSAGLAARTIERLDQERSSEPSWWRRLASRVDAALGSFGAHRPTRVTGLATTAVVLALLVPVLSPNWERGRSVGTVSGCRLNLRLLGKALDRYAASHDGVYPAELGELAPDYIRRFPDCPHAGVNTYLPGYRRGVDPHHYRLACHGHHHADAGLPAEEPSVGR